MDRYQEVTQEMNKIKEDRERIIIEMRSLIETAEKRGDLSAYDEEKVVKMEAEISRLDDAIEKLRDQKRSMAPNFFAVDAQEAGGIDHEQRFAARSSKEIRIFLPGQPRPDGKLKSYEGTDFRDVNAYFQKGYLTQEQRVRAENRALQMDSDPAGGYTVMPEYFSNQVIKAMDNMVFFRNMATVVQFRGAHSLTAPYLDADPADPTWVSELSTGVADGTMSFEGRSLSPHPLAQRILVSNKLIYHNANIAAFVRDRLAYKNAIVQENAFLNGNGANQPLGCMVAHDSGIPSGSTNDISTGNTQTSIKADGLIEALYSLPAQYRMKPQWIFHRDAVKQIRKLKDGEGQYLWQSGLQTGTGANILGLPYHESEYMPNTFTTGLYVGIVGDFSFYWIAESMSIQIQVLKELYAATNQTGFISRVECDGAPVHAGAFRRVTLA